MSGASNEFSAALALARTEAIRSTRSAGICGANAAGTACVNSTQWPDGMLIWLNADVAAPDYDAADTLVRFVQGKKGLALSVPVSSATGNAQFRLLFDSRGRLADQPAAGRIATLKSEQCPSGQTLARNFAINAAGQANMTRVNCS
ncbi:GspH/FimT family pseudopilin [Luteimonas fraxinea]|uniref:GspH/FimT family pseudopilin n=1 Tax=Luteimonas fraxinea TaxID=2901869 RepID=A0ABS8UBJ9_9GAMM|nr:GspH/FimT family pseudopilin [Luteimonas fraxinea]MCD9124698.1 GspH/FimT family pseudopilin [Luteimonas fraxinea]UHH11827.1 GspH/FimT family pseudopilin [Luteimonas fraxinea]